MRSKLQYWLFFTYKKIQAGRCSHPNVGCTSNEEEIHLGKKKKNKKWGQKSLLKCKFASSCRALIFLLSYVNYSFDFPGEEPVSVFRFYI